VAVQGVTLGRQFQDTDVSTIAVKTDLFAGLQFCTARHTTHAHTHTHTHARAQHSHTHTPHTPRSHSQ
jgi:hypothetical protein